MSSRPAVPPPHPRAAEVDWAAVQEEAAQTLSQYVKFDSSHPVGRTIETAQLLIDRLEDPNAPARQILPAAQLRRGQSTARPRDRASRAPAPAVPAAANGAAPAAPIPGSASSAGSGTTVHQGEVA